MIRCKSKCRTLLREVEIWLRYWPYPEMTRTKHIPTFHDVTDKVSVLFWKMDKENEFLIFNFPDTSKMKIDFWERAFETA